MKARFGTRLILIIVAVFLLLFSIVTLYVGIRSNGIALDKETVDVLKELQEAEKPDIGELKRLLPPELFDLVA